jgi:hypothetical protein
MTTIKRRLARPMIGNHLALIGQKYKGGFKQMRKVTFIIYSIAVSLLMLGLPTVSGYADGGTLTRTKAEKLIRTKFGLTKNVKKKEVTTALLLSWDGFCNGRRTNPCKAAALDEATNSLISEGLVTVAFDGDTSRMSLAQKGQQYAAGGPTVGMRSDGSGGFGSKYVTLPVFISYAEFGAITGIQVFAQFNTATVEWTVIKTATPFGNRPLGRSMVYGGTNEFRTGTIKLTAEFKKYDDGWRISD